MMKEMLFNLIGKHHYNISIYTEEIFERRCQEEIIRSDEEQSSFVYLEFNFESIRNLAGSDELNIQFWGSFLATLVKNSRGSDIIGFLENTTGIGMLLLDSKIEGWKRMKGRIEQTASEKGFSNMPQILDSLIKPIVYPACVQDIQQEST